MRLQFKWFNLATLHLDDEEGNPVDGTSLEVLTVHLSWGLTGEIYETIYEAARVNAKIPLILLPPDCAICCSIRRGEAFDRETGSLNPIKFRTPPAPFKHPVTRLIVDIPHIPYMQQIGRMENEQIGEQYLYSLNRSIEFWESMYKESFFILDNRGLLSVPNPISRFCISLEPGASPGKLQRKVSGLRLTINRDLDGVLKRTAEYHANSKSSTWLTAECIESLVRIYQRGCLRDKAETQEHDRLSFWSFELRDANSDELLATSIGYACGSNFHDVTAATFVRDKRSLGKLLLELERLLLMRCGFKLWYLGMELDYMKTLKGFVMKPGDFFSVWNSNRTIGVPQDLLADKALEGDLLVGDWLFV